MNLDNIPDNPSPFQNSKDDLNHALEDVKMFQKHFGELISKWKLLDFFAKKLGQSLSKHEEFPLMFVRVHSSENIDYDEIPERSIFTAGLRRSNKDFVLGKAYDWLVEQNMMNPAVLREEFIVNYWKQNFENIIV